MSYQKSVALLRQARANWLSVLLLTVLGAGAGTATAFLLPTRYEAAAAFQAENPPAQLPLALGRGLTGIIGPQFSGLIGSPNSPWLLADLLKTDALLRRVVNARFPWQGHSAALGTIYGYGDKAPPLRDYLAAGNLRHNLSVNVDLRTGIVRLTVEAPTPELALAIAESTLVALNEANVELRKQRASAERGFTAAQSVDAGRALAAAESTLAAFHRQNHRVSAPPALEVQEWRLRRNVDMAQYLFEQLRLQEAQAQLQELRNTPAISVIDPPVLPVRRSWPKRRLALATGLAIGLALALLRLVLKPVPA